MSALPITAEAATEARSCTEAPLVFTCEGQRLVGVLATPDAGQAQADTGVVVVVGGPQYRAGSHRLFVKLARELASAGHPVLRFDARGMGDSEGDFPGFEHLTPDIGAAIDTLLAQRPGVQRVVLWGLCDAAAASLLYWHATRDARVVGMALANPWVRSAASLARTQVKHYYTRRLLERGFWIKLASGGVGVTALGALLRNLRLARDDAAGDGTASAARYQDRMAASWQHFKGPLLLLMSGDDYTAREFDEYVATDQRWAGALQRAGLLRQDLADADHTFSGRMANAWVIASTRRWLGTVSTPACNVAPAASPVPID